MNVLVVVYYWPPSAGSGVQRWLKMTKYMQGEECNVHVLTPANPDFHIKDETLMDDVHPDVKVVKRNIWEPYKIARLITGKKINNTGTDNAGAKKSFISKVLRFIRANFFMPDPRKFWVKPSARFLSQYIPQNDIDVIITSGPPHSLHKIGYLCSQKFSDLKWIMDVRDPISQLDFVGDLGVKGGTIKRYKEYERRMLSTADAVVGTSYSLPDYLEKFDLEKFHTIPNGFDAADFQNMENESGSEIVVSHAGIYNQYRYASCLWNALGEFREEHEVKVVFAGPISESVMLRSREISELGDKLVNVGYIDHNAVLKLYAESTILLLLSNKSEMGTTTIPGKIFELMASGKPILGFGNPEGDAARILRESGCGEMFSYDEDPAVVLRKLNSFINKPQRTRDEEYIKQFSRDELAKRYRKLCKQLIQS